MPISPVVERARALLERKALTDLPAADRVQASLRGRGVESSADDFYSALVEGAFLVAAADGSLSTEESSTLGETIAYVTGDVLPPREFMAMIDAFAEARTLDGEEGRLRTIADAIPDESARREVVAFAALLALCDRNLDEREWHVLRGLAAAFDMPEERLTVIVDGLRETLAG